MRYFPSFSILLSLCFLFFFVGSFGFTTQNVISLSCIQKQQKNIGGVNKLFSQQESQSTATTTITDTKGVEDDDEEGNTVVRLTNPSNGMMCTLVGTAHLSKASNDQVREIITTVRPSAVLVELDITRLERIGFKESGEDLGLPFVTCEGILPPLEDDDKVALENQSWWWQPIENFVLDSGSNIARQFLTQMYNTLANEMSNDDDDYLIPGGEFKVAIETARDITECQRVILGDRESMTTLRRGAELAVRTGNVMEVFNKLGKVNEEEFKAATEEIKKEYPGEDDLTDGEFTVKVVERLKSDKTRRAKLFDNLKKQVPEFSRAFLQERDYIMAECINRENEENNIEAKQQHVVAVVGLAHVPGITKNLKQSWNIVE
eukprot:CAMPEP_0194139306 /NCGR_PEP_ID=MMETSP0152-20130528/8973_1 /TAXON_ID=1049557 /ORGANISM="Thalassiothrix antarctica, Strain L6-D1" /LENGTH=375 /DNA_ID=CAMNT_0038837089 /DNA_START=61 /DNA_END=1188 /DNA_ORIENTATION=-